jgi:hypothetical protein
MKIYIGSPVYRDVSMRFHGAIQRLERAINKMELEAKLKGEEPLHQVTYGYIPGDADVGRARNIAASIFLREGHDVLLTIDSDIWFRPEDALRICEEAMTRDIVGGLYMVRSVFNSQPAPLIDIDKEIIMAAGQEPVEAKYLATGFMAVHRRVFEKLADGLPLCMQTTPYPFWPFYLQYAIPWPNDGHLYLSEDYAFCQRARDAGFKIWLDPSIRLGHVGNYEFRLEDLLTEFPSPMPMKIVQRNGHCEVEGFPEKEPIRGVQHAK